jgi:hypothetical protein
MDTKDAHVVQPSDTKSVKPTSTGEPIKFTYRGYALKPHQWYEWTGKTKITVTHHGHSGVKIHTFSDRYAVYLDGILPGEKSSLHSLVGGGLHMTPFERVKYQGYVIPAWEWHHWENDEKLIVLPSLEAHVGLIIHKYVVDNETWTVYVTSLNKGEVVSPQPVKRNPSDTDNASWWDLIKADHSSEIAQPSDTSTSKVEKKHDTTDSVPQEFVYYGYTLKLDQWYKWTTKSKIIVSASTHPGYHGMIIHKYPLGYYNVYLTDIADGGQSPLHCLVGKGDLVTPYEIFKYQGYVIPAWEWCRWENDKKLIVLPTVPVHPGLIAHTYTAMSEKWHVYITSLNIGEVFRPVVKQTPDDTGNASWWDMKDMVIMYSLALKSGAFESKTSSPTPTATVTDVKSVLPPSTSKKPEMLDTRTVDDLIASLQHVKARHGGKLNVWLQGYQQGVNGSVWQGALYGIVDNVALCKDSNQTVNASHPEASKDASKPPHGLGLLLCHN